MSMTVNDAHDVITGRTVLSPSEAMVEEYTQLALTHGVNLGQLIAKTYMTVEEVSQTKSHAKIDELQALEKKLSSVTSFLGQVETGLSNHNARSIRVDTELVQNMHNLLDQKIPLLSKSEWTREEAEVIVKSMTRHSQTLMQQIHHSSSDVNRHIEQGTELLQIARKVLEMADRLCQTFTSNQRR